MSPADLRTLHDQHLDPLPQTDWAARRDLHRTCTVAFCALHGAWLMLRGNGDETAPPGVVAFGGKGMRGLGLWQSAGLVAALLWGGVAPQALAQERTVSCDAVTGETRHHLTLTLGRGGAVKGFDYSSFGLTNSEICGVDAAWDDDGAQGMFSLEWKTRPDGTVHVAFSEPNRYTEGPPVGTATIRRQAGGYRLALAGDVWRFCDSRGDVDLAPVATLTPGQQACKLEQGAPGQVRARPKATGTDQPQHTYDPAVDPPPPSEFAVVGVRAYYYHQETGAAGGEDLALGKTSANLFGDDDGPSGATWVLVDLERRPAPRTPVQKLLLTAQVPGRTLLRKQVEVGEFFTEKDRIAIPFLVYGTGCEELKLRAVLSTAGRKQTQVMDGSVPFACHE